MATMMEVAGVFFLEAAPLLLPMPDGGGTFIIEYRVFDGQRNGFHFGDAISLLYLKSGLLADSMVCVSWKMKMLPPALWWGAIILFGSSSNLFSPPRSINEPSCLAEGLVNVAPFSRWACCWPRSRQHTLVKNSRDDTSAAIAGELFPTRPTAEILPESSSSSSLSDVTAHGTQVSSLQTTIPSTTSQFPSQSAESASGSSQKRQKPAQRMGVWMPPSKNVDQRRGKIFSIQKPQDLLDFVIEDERLSVGE